MDAFMAIVKEFIYKNRKNSLAMNFITNYNAPTKHTKSE